MLDLHQGLSMILMISCLHVRRRQSMTSSRSLCNPVSKERYLISCAGWNLQSLGQVFNQDDGGSELQGVFQGADPAVFT